MRPARVAAERSNSPNLTGGLLRTSGLLTRLSIHAKTEHVGHESALPCNGRRDGNRKRLLRIKKESKVDCPADSSEGMFLVSSWPLTTSRPTPQKQD
jgi:hypothetical protein